MKGIGALLSTTVALSASGVLGSVTQLVKRQSRELPAITVKGNAFFNGNERFYVRGVDYQPGGSSDISDPLADTDVCRRDIAKFKELGANTIRIYTVDNSANHDECMTALAEAGIYLVLDLNTPKYSLNRNEPKLSYNDVYLQNIFATVDRFAGYTNVLAFFSGNEVINDADSTNTAPYVKAITRDIRQYIGSRGYRKIPVGYSAADVSENRLEMAQYMNCGSDDERSDFFAFNDYSWCDPSDFEKSGWDQKVQNFSDYSIPLFLSEFGCNTNKREFNEIASLYSDSMSSVFSGGLVYEYSQEPSNYGLVEISGGSVTELEDFQTLKDAYSKQSNPSGDGGYKQNGAPSQCPPPSANWDVQDNSLPAIPEPAKKYMTQGAGKAVGLTGAGSQNAGTGSPGTARSGSGTVTSVASGQPKKNAAVALPAFSSAHLISVAAALLAGVAAL